MSEEKKAFTGSDINQMLKLGLILALFAVVACFLLALVNQCTAPQIAANALAKTNAAMKVVFPEADNFEEIDPSKYAQPDGRIKIQNMYLVKKAGQTIGIVTRVNGPTYDNTTLIVGQDLDGNVTGVEILETSDSPGFGQKAADPNYTVSTGDTFAGQFAGKSVADGFAPGDTFEAISGATITSRGIGAILNAATAVASNYLSGNGTASVGPSKEITADDMKLLFPDATSFEEASGFAATTDDDISVEKVYIIYRNGEPIGSITRVSGRTFQDSTLLVAQDMNHTITGVHVVSTTDTDGLGGNMKEPAFTSQFKGKSTRDELKPGVHFDGISGATITSERVGKLISKATSTADGYLAKVGSKPASTASSVSSSANVATESTEEKAPEPETRRPTPGVDAVFDYDGALGDLASVGGFGGASFADVTGKSSGEKIRRYYTVEKLYTISSGGKVVAACAAMRGPTHDGEGIVMTTVNAQRKIIGVRIIELPDAYEYAAPNLASSFYRQFENMNVDENILAGQKYDAISGASITSDCIADLIRVGADEAAYVMSRNGGQREPDGLAPYTLNNHLKK